MRVRAFPGKREEANRAGITPRIRVRTIDLSINLVGQTIAFCGLPARDRAAQRRRQTAIVCATSLLHYTEMDAGREEFFCQWSGPCSVGVAGRGSCCDVLPCHWLPLALLGPGDRAPAGPPLLRAGFSRAWAQRETSAAVSFEKFLAGSRDAGRLAR